MYEMRNLENGTNYRKSKTAGHMYEIQTTMFTQKNTENINDLHITDTERETYAK